MAIVVSLLLVLILLLVTSQGVPQNNEATRYKAVENFDENQFRLPKHVVPIRYDVKLIPHIVENNFTTNGETSIDVEVREPTSAIALHALRLTIEESLTKIIRKDVNDVNFKSEHVLEQHEYNEVTQILTLRFEGSLDPGIYTLHFNFTGVILPNAWTRGFYRSFYTDNEGNKVWLAVTHFQPPFARQAFPCWDEPAMKATFKFSIKHYPNYTALSNMPSTRSEVDATDGKLWTHFETTPIMSTNLLGFVIADYDYVSNLDGTIKIWGPKHLLSHAAYSLDIAEKATQELEKFTNSTVRVPKMDHVGVPHYDSRATENWGMIVYAQNILLEDKSAHPINKMLDTMTITHELAHQWFGNLISPIWWKYLWLSEGISTYLKFYITDKFFKEKRLMDFMVVNIEQQVLYKDSIRSKPIHVNISGHRNVYTAYSIETYRKSALLLRMASYFLREDVFRNGLIKYLQAHEYNSTTQDDLWKALQDALDESDVPHDDFKVKEVMDTWFEQAWYPLVTINRDYDTGRIKITQEIFKYSPTNHNVNGNEAWWIPLNFATQNNLDFSSTLATHWLKPHDEDVTIEGVNTNDWIIANKHLTGFYRVNYDTTNWKRIAAFLNSDNYDKVPVLNRAQILDDAYYMMQTERLDPVTFVEIINYLSRETDPAPWYRAFRNLEVYLKDYLRLPEGAAILKPYLSNLMHKLFEHINFEENPNDDPFTVHVRAYLYKYDCMYGLSECQAKVTAKLLAYMEDPIANKLSPNQELIYCFGLIKANESFWNQFLQAQQRKLKSETWFLGCSENLQIIERHLNSFSEDMENYYNIFYNMLERLPNIDVAIEYFINNYEKFDQNLNHAFILHVIKQSIIMNSFREDQINKIKAFAEQHKIHMPPHLNDRIAMLSKMKDDLSKVRSALENRQSIDTLNNHNQIVDKYHKEMEEYYGEQSTIATILDGTSQCLTTTESINKFDRLINNHREDFTSIQQSLERSLKIAQHELELFNSYSASIIQRLRKYDEAKFPLPENIIPKSYIVSVTPYFEDEDATFDGKVTIKADVKQHPTSQIVLHWSGIEIKRHNVTFKVKNKNIMNKVLKTKIKERYDFLVIYLEKELPKDAEVTIEIEYTSSLNPAELRGFYKSSYVNENNETRWLVASHLEPVGARKMFPCFDEPAMKATFTVEVSVPPNYEPISNMVYQALLIGDNRTTYTFYETPKMSTYLVALIVSDFKSNSTRMQDGTTLSVHARTNAIDQTDYALSIISPLMSFFEKRYNQKYPLSKLSMAALPDFGSGAMENWGLLTYRESSMLYDENHSPITNRQDIRNVIAHEISHQWFGNLVSPRLWKYLWLNEGFARYFEYRAPARVFNDTTSESQFVVDQVHSAFKADSSKSAHALSHDVASPEQIRSIFDTITYAKGGSILRMVEKTFGTDVLDKALTDYLSKGQYNSTEPDHLYDSLQQQINEKGLKEDIKVILDTWTIQPGYPIVNVHVSNTFIVMNQKRFFLKKEEDNSDTTMWYYIPITWTSVQNSSKDSDTTPKLWMKHRITRVLNPLPNSLLIFNKQQSGFYRVNYKKEHWMELIDYLKNENFETIDEINRAALIDDLMNLARAGYIDYKIAISATMYLKQETSYYPWIAFFNNLPYLNNRFTGRDIEGLYKNWLTSLVDKILGNLGGFGDDKEIDDDLTMMLRKHTRNWACKLGIDRCIFTALEYFQEKQHSKTIPPNYRDVVYCTAMRKDKTDYSYKFLWKEYLSSNVNTDKLVILNSLACSENKVVLETLLQEAITPNSNIRYQDSAKVFSSVYDASLIGVEVVMEVIEKYYDNLLQRHYNDYTKIANIVSALASRLSTNDLFEKYQGLLEWLVDKEPEFKRYVDSYLATAKYEFDWYDTKAPVVFETLDNLFLSNTHRLPKALEPRLYDIHLTPHMEEGTFEGKVKIHMEVRENTPLIALNSHKLDILNVKVFRNGAEIQLVNYTTHIPQQLRIYLSNYVHANEEIIAEIDFNGTLNDDMNGFYRSSYLDNGVQHWLATTQFEPTYARQAFPCFDEPAFKSRFTINIQRPKNYYKSLSNMPLEKETPVNDEYVLDTFYTSNVNMSTYLVAFVVSKFKSTSKPDNEHLNVWGRPEVASHGERARIIGMQVIYELENITDIDFPLPKLDLIGIPDFSNGAMENWGLATFREYGLFFDKKETTSTYEKYVSNVIAHELTHMWFGNLVTCEWWDYIWLNEGFAEYFEWFISEQIHPEDKFMDQFVVYELHPALAKDASTSTHSMTNRVRTPEEIADIFDYVTYGKSSSVLRMMFNAFGQNATISALRDYLTKRMYSTARPADLWESFESFVKIPILNRDASVEEVMSTWTDQPGYPVVNATYISSILTLSQERFLINKNKPDDEPKFSEFYWIPITIFVQSNMLNDNITSEVTWLGSTPQTKIINSNNDWFIVNYKQTGFYRVNYDPFSWKKIINQLNNKEFEKIDVLNRAQIIDDLFNLARANYVDYELLMSASTYLKQEKNHLPWKAFFNGLSYVHERFEQHSTGNNSQFLKDLNGYLLDLVSDMYDKVGFEDYALEKLLDKLNREIILQWTCKLYNNRGWENILYALKYDDLNNIHVLNRAAIVDDLLNLGRAGYISYDTVLDGLYYLPRETDYLPYKAAFNGLEFLNKRFTGSMEHTLFKVYVESLIENANVRLEYDDNKNDDRLTILLRRDVNNWLCKLDNKECVTTYTEKFKAWRTNSAARIEPNARPTAYCTAIKHGTSDDWEYLWQEYFNSNYPTDQMVILNALGCSQNTTILEKYLKYAIAGYETSRIRKQDSKTVFAAVYNSGLLGAEYILDFVDKYHKEMEE
ncbi:PREDICTED: uncharacterized protein LOC105461501 [Wasmannia auropunctata]|uniref:uncharacterized protein LOC105461501 n=1 Tax=Wasmannia auropunctata TaxID=64793 RepID=UPI0005EF517A|nr:PREDICTED: uncharacterized protein LOC105461501 [Wasmannia auropunctata]